MGVWGATKTTHALTLSRPRDSSADGHEAALGDLAGVGQIAGERHLGGQRVHQRGVEADDPEGVVRELHGEHVEIEVDVAGELPGVLGGADFAAAVREQPL